MTTLEPHHWRFIQLGEAAMLIEVSLSDTELANRFALALAEQIHNAHMAGVQSVVPAINSVLVRFDPLLLTWMDIKQRINVYLMSAQLSDSSPRHIVTIPVHYGGEHGPDLDEVANALGLSPADVIAHHTAHFYRVMMIGFAPGFPYIGPLPQCLTLPRRATPRAAVPAGSVAIAAGMTGIYPSRLPGGWHLIGRTDIALFDQSRASPSLLRAGDHVQFVAC